MSASSETISKCPVCQRKVPSEKLEGHVNECFENQIKIKTSSPSPSTSKRPISDGASKTFDIFNRAKKLKIDDRAMPTNKTSNVIEIDDDSPSSVDENAAENSKSTQQVSNVKTVLAAVEAPLAELIRAQCFDEYFGQQKVVGEKSIFRNLLRCNSISSMIFWGPPGENSISSIKIRYIHIILTHPGCGKTTLAHIIWSHCNQEKDKFRFVKLSACTSGINDVKEVVKQAKTQRDTFKKRTILFMDEIHRFNKLQQDAFLPHVENGTIVLIGATTENPSFSLNSALLSRTRVFVLEKLASDDIVQILRRALAKFKAIEVTSASSESQNSVDFIPELGMSTECLRWIADISDGDARIALNSLEMCLRQAKVTRKDNDDIAKRIITLDEVKEGVKKSHLLYDRAGDQHYDIISALHKSIRASDDNAALYWVTRMMESGEDPRFIVRRLIRQASEDIGLADPNALTLAASTFTAVQQVGMPEADCIIAQLVVYLARAPKSMESYLAVKRCKEMIRNHKGIQPAVPLEIRNAPTKLMADLGYNRNYNKQHKDVSGLRYLPECMDDVDFFND